MRIALEVEYDGHEFYGWQAQSGLMTIQGCLEDALSIIANERIKLFCAGRTDAGVHATGQVVHFDTQTIRHMRAWTLGTNTHLPPTIVVRSAHEVDETFHARFSALSRRYRYVIYNAHVRSAIFAARATWYPHQLDIELMKKAASYLLGEQDFTSFRSSQCDANSPMRNVHQVQIMRENDFIFIDIQANAFLHHMVRNIVGVLLRIGSKLMEPQIMQHILQAKDRKAAFETAPPTGLYLTRVDYPEPYVFVPSYTTKISMNLP